MLNVSLCWKDNVQHVYKIEPLMTKSMYGYHDKDSLFCKIYLYNPSLIRKLSDLLLNGNIMNESFQPYEAHVPFNLQFLMDFNLFGMNWIYLDKVNNRQEQNDDDNPLNRQSTCELECDASSDDILNPNMNKSEHMLNPGLSALWEEEIKRRDQACILKEMETPDLEGYFYHIFTSFIYFLIYILYTERTSLLQMDNENDFKSRLINLLETRYYLIIRIIEFLK